MIHNDVLRSVRYMLDISDKKVIEIIKLGGMDVTLADLLTWLDKKEEDEEGFVRCPDEVMAHFLDGLVILKAAEFPVSKPELSALFRKFGHTNYRPCGDQLLRNFLKGLTLRVRPQ
jgi:uncharacterized protein YehS (DUF1456 family)